MEPVWRPPIRPGAGYCPPVPPDDNAIDQPPNWGMGDAAAGLLLANVAAVLIGSLILAATGNGSTDSDDLPLTMVAALQIPLWLGYFGVPVWAARTKGNGVVADFGLRMRWMDAPIGLVIGVLTQVALIPILYVPIFWLTGEQDLSAPARGLTDRASDPFGVVVLVAIVVIGAPIVEELFWRGLLLRSVEKRFGTGWAVAASSLLFGAIHLQFFQFPALALAGLVFAPLTVRSGRLGPAIWAHVGFNGIAVITLLSESAS